MSEPDEQKLFPEEACLKIIAELSVWTSVDNCLAAARWIEKRSRPDDAPSEKPIVPYPDDDGYEAVFVKCLQWLIQGYQTPPTKVRLAALLDPLIIPQTCSALSHARFAPNIHEGPPGSIGELFPPLADHRDKRSFIVADSPYIIELIQNPLRCLIGLINQAWPTATKMRALREKAMKETGGAPTIFHQPYTDGPLFALVEALVFYSQGLAIGPNMVSETEGVNRGYRSTEVVGRPPLDPRMFEIAQRATKEMFHSLE